MGQTWIYLIRDNSTGLHKIGFSQNPEKRLKNLCRQSTLLPTPNDFILVEAWWHLTETETKLHALFESSRVRGEWFNLSPENITHIYDLFYECKRFTTGTSEQAESAERFEQEEMDQRLYAQAIAESAGFYDVYVEGFGVEF